MELSEGQYIQQIKFNSEKTSITCFLSDVQFRGGKDMNLKGINKRKQKTERETG